MTAGREFGSASHGNEESNPIPSGRTYAHRLVASAFTLNSDPPLAARVAGRSGAIELATCRPYGTLNGEPNLMMLMIA